jgi:hypothetical protein
MFFYNIQSLLRYRRRVIGLAILTDDLPNWRPKGFSYGGFGCRTGIRFPVVKLLDYAGRQEELANSDNPVARVVLAHLKAQARGAPKDQKAAKIRLVKGLYEQGWSADDVRQAFRLIDWLITLPQAQQEEFRQEIYQFEEGQKMPYVTSIERLAKKEGRKEGGRSW